MTEHGQNCGCKQNEAYYGFPCRGKHGDCTVVTLEALRPTNAFGLPRHYEFHHVFATNADGTPSRIRANGALKVWKRPLPDGRVRWRLPVKHGLRECFYIGTDAGSGDPSDWYVGYGCETPGASPETGV